MATFVRKFFTRKFATPVAGGPAHLPSLLLEDGFYLLQEDGTSSILLEP